MMQLWEERQQASSLPTIRDLAETLRISPEQAGLLLGEVRARKVMPPQMMPPRRVANDKLVFFGGLAAAICVTAIFAVTLLFFSVRPSAGTSVRPPIVLAPVAEKAYDTTPAPTPMTTAKAGGDFTTNVAPEGTAVPTTAGNNR